MMGVVRDKHGVIRESYCRDDLVKDRDTKF